MELVTGCPLFRGCLSIEVNRRTVKTLELSIALWMSAAEGCPLSGIPLYRVYCIYLPSSLVPWPLPFLPSICIQNNTREWKIGEKRTRPGSIHNVSGCKVNVGGRGQYSNMYVLNLKAISYWSRRVALITLTARVQTATEHLNR